MSTVAALLDMVELNAPDSLVQKRARLIVRRVVAVSQDLLHEDIRCESAANQFQRHNPAARNAANRLQRFGSGRNSKRRTHED